MAVSQHFVKMCLTVPTSRSINPLDFGEWSDAVVCSKPYAWLNSSNSLKANYCPLLLNGLVDIPYSSNMLHRMLMVTWDDKVVSFLTIESVEKVSPTNRYVSPYQEKKSPAIVCQAWDMGWNFMAVQWFSLLCWLVFLACRAIGYHVLTVFRHVDPEYISLS